MDLDKIGLEAIKPAAGFVDALLGPKIAKLKKWTSEKELSHDIESLSKIMEQYLIKLSHKVCEITSLAIPATQLDIYKAYEPLIIGREYWQAKKWKEYNSLELLNAHEDKFLLIDNAGMGKSTFSKYMITQCLTKSEKIPIFLELRKIQDDCNLLECMAKEFDLLGSKFNRSLFFKLLDLGKFFIILDGFDEIAQEKQAELANEIGELSNNAHKNTLFVTSRNQSFLPTITKGLTMQFACFSRKQAESLLLRYDEIVGNDTGQNLIVELDHVPRKLLETPLLISLLYRTFEVNRSVANRISSFYEEVYLALYKGHDLINKSGYEREKKSKLDYVDFKRVLISFCFLMTAESIYSFRSRNKAIEYIKRAMIYTSIDEAKAEGFFEDLLVSVPLMHRDGNEFKFLHQTLPEYFSAEYIVYNENSSSLLTKIYKSKRSLSFEKVLEFVADINPSLFDEVITLSLVKNINIEALSSNFENKVLNTLNLKNTCYYGIFDNIPEEFDTHTIRSCTVTTNSKIAFLCLAFSPKPPVNAKAFERVSRIKKVSVEELKLDEVNDEWFNEDSISELNNWLELDKDAINILSNCKSFIKLAYRELKVLLIKLNENEAEFGQRLLSRKKVEALMDNERTKNEYKTELESFFE